MGVGRALQVTACGGRSDPGCHHAPPGSCKLFPGTVSERPKDHVSKTCVGATPPWVQIPPVPPGNRIASLRSQISRGYAVFSWCDTTARVEFVS